LFSISWRGRYGRDRLDVPWQKPLPYGRGSVGSLTTRKR
jgi:hypothetical protein